jgi:hypothetical protein
MQKLKAVGQNIMQFRIHNLLQRVSEDVPPVTVTLES